MASGELAGSDHVENIVSTSEELQTQILVTESDYVDVGSDINFKKGAITLAWNAIHNRASRYDYNKGWLKRTKPDTEVSDILSEWLAEYSFIDGLYVRRGYLSAIVLKRVVDSGELIQLPKVGVKSFRLSAEVVERVFSSPPVDN